MPQGTADIDAQIETLQATFNASSAAASNTALLAELEAHPGTVYDAGLNSPSWMVQTWHLTHRSFLNMMRDISVFGLRAAMYIMLCVVLGFVYFQLDHSWCDAEQSKSAVLAPIAEFLP